MLLDPFGPLSGDRDVVILDGGLATELERRGADLRDGLWSARVLIEKPELIERTHVAYFRRVPMSPSRRATRRASRASRREGSVDEEGAALMRESIPSPGGRATDGVAAAPPGRPRPLVAASVGPYGAMLANGSEYTGDYDRTTPELRTFHARRLDVLADPGPAPISSRSRRSPRSRRRRRSRKPSPSTRRCPRGSASPAATAHTCATAPRSTRRSARSRLCRTWWRWASTAPRPPTSRPLVSIAAAHTDTRVLAYPNRGAAYDPSRRRGRARGRRPRGVAGRGCEPAPRSSGGCCGTGPGGHPDDRGGPRPLSRPERDPRSRPPVKRSEPELYGDAAFRRGGRPAALTCSHRTAKGARWA